MPRMTLLISAEGTLWENNVYIERTIERFLTLVEPFGYARGYARHVLNETERLNIRQHGYGMRSFARSLEETYMKLAGELVHDSGVREVSALVDGLEDTPPHVLEGVPETLQYLHERHRMILYASGEAAEQAGKVERSGLQGFFDAIEIIAEKTPQVYDELVVKHHVVKSHGWLMGSSQAGDILPGLQAGLNVAFVPDPANEDQPQMELPGGTGKLLIVCSFRDLRDHF
jgi:putative hydrolase of the HAD superfamily